MSLTDSSMSFRDFSEDPGRALNDLVEKNQPTLLTHAGKGVAVVQGLDLFEAEQEEKRFMRAVVQGLVDLEHGRDFSIGEVKQRLGLN